MSLSRLTLAAILVLAQAIAPSAFRLGAQPTPEESKIVKRVIRVQHVNPEEVSELLRSWGSNMNASKELGIITVIGQTKDVDQIEAAVRSLDVPPAENPDTNVELTVHFLGVTEEESTEKLPSGLDAVVEQLKPNFPYAGYQLLDTLITRARVDRDTEVSGVEPDPSGNRSVRPMIYQFRARVTGISGAVGARTVHLHNLRAGFRVPILINKDEYGYSDLGVNTDIDIPEGKLIVVGKTGMQGKSRGMFVILQVRVDE